MKEEWVKTYTPAIREGVRMLCQALAHGGSRWSAMVLSGAPAAEGVKEDEAATIEAEAEEAAAAEKEDEEETTFGWDSFRCVEDY